MDKTFTEAAESYVEHGGQKKYLGPVVGYFEGKSLGSIYPFDVRQMAIKIYPGHKNSTLVARVVVS